MHRMCVCVYSPFFETLPTLKPSLPQYLPFFQMPYLPNAPFLKTPPFLNNFPLPKCPTIFLNIPPPSSRPFLPKISFLPKTLSSSRPPIPVYGTGERAASEAHRTGEDDDDDATNEAIHFPTSPTTAPTVVCNRNASAMPICIARFCITCAAAL
jgi:hypothetical protein